MSQQSYNGINGFALKPPSQYATNNTNNKFKFINRREGEANNKEFIEITKERNKLPRVTLRTYVLYYRNNGNIMTTNYPGVGPTVDSNENYRFYNDLSVLKSGSTWTEDGGGYWLPTNINNISNVYANSTSGNGTITAGNTNAARFDIQKTNGGQDLKITCDIKGENFVAGDTITFKAALNNWLSQDLTFTVTSGQVNESAIGRQLGWIFGFPLFDVSSNANNWPRFNSCYSNDANDISGNQKMLVDISDKNNIIVLDMSKFQFLDGNTKKGDGFDDISNNIPGQTNNFYMTLRITGSSENSIEFGGTAGVTVYEDGLNSNTSSTIKMGKNGNWTPFPTLDYGDANVYNDVYGRYSNKWCTLVEYEFYCDIVNPKSFLDFTPDYFSYDFSFINNNTTVNGRRFIGNESEESYITNEFTDSSIQINNYTQKITLKIKTGLGRDAAANNNITETMSPGNIIKGLALSVDLVNVPGYNFGGASPIRIKEKNAWNASSNWQESWTVAKIIGGWYSRGDSASSNTRNIGYYGTIVSTNPGSRQTKYNETESWKNDLTLNNTGSNNVWTTDNNNNKSYDLNNILWCSLRSPRKIKVTYIGDTSTQGQDTVLVGKHRFVTNFIELQDSTNGSNEILGGGFARNSNELDLPRKSEKPYFSKYNFQTNSSGGYDIINSNTVAITDYDIDNSTQYLDASSNNNSATLTLNDVNYYKIQYKLLIPPESGKNYNITYSFGKTNGCVTTFFRFPDMSGNPFPDGSNNQFAVRDSESIELKWEAGETDIKTIYITDIASGTNIVNSTIATNDVALTNTINDENYDLSFNVFQLFFFSRNAINETNTIRDELPYTIYTFDTTSSDEKFIDISYTPVGYVPYRYFNYFKKVAAGAEREVERIFFTSDFSVGPLITREEKIKYNPGKIFPKGNSIVERTNALVIDPSNTDVFPQVDIDISGDVIFDMSFAVVPNQLTPEEASLPQNQGQEIATFDEQLNTTGDYKIFKNDKILFQIQASENKAFTIGGFSTPLFFDQPLQLMLDNYLIPDYWRLPNKLNIIRTTNETGSIPDLDDYRYYNKWESQIRTSMVFDILSIVLKSTGGNLDGARISNILVNTNIKARGSSEYSAITNTGNLLNNMVNDLVYDVQGAFGVPPTDYLNLEPIIVLLKASFDGPFGTLGQNFIGNKATAEGGINVPYPAQPGIPQNDSKFVVNTVLLDTLRRGNNVDGSDLGGGSSAYNGIFNIDSEVPDKEDYGLLKQNNSFIGTIIGPSPLPVLLVDISSAVQVLDPAYSAQFNMLNDENNKVTIDWSGFSFSRDPNWNLGESDIYWTITRYNLSTGVSKVLLINTQIKYDLVNDKYTFIDTTPIIFTKYRYTISGIFYWTGITNYVNTSQIPYLNVPGFSTPDILVCKFNRFPYGRFNTTSTNLKLYAPLRLTTPEGQEDQNGNKIGGPCRDPNNPSLQLFTRTSRISSSNNIYANTTNQVSKKQTYVILSKSRFRPFR